MAKDIVCAEAELSIAANNLVEYADFLSRTIESYVTVLSEIQKTETAITNTRVSFTNADNALAQWWGSSEE